MERHFEYPAKIEQDSGDFFLLTFPDFPEAATDAAMVGGIDCLEEAVAARMKRGEDIPAPSEPGKGMVPITLPALYAMKAALYLALRDAECRNPRSLRS
jgi:antitoxin HicB